jgi:hypothetical protein
MEVEESDESPIIPKEKLFETKKVWRKQKRDHLQDINRPFLNEESQSESDKSFNILSIDDGWIVEEDNDHEKNSKLDKSLQHIVHIEHHQKEQQKKRRKSYCENRRSSIKSKMQLCEPNRDSMNDCERYNSCASLLSEISIDSNFNNLSKSFSKSFIMSNVSEVNRMSDYYVPSKPQQTSSTQIVKHPSRDQWWSFDWKDVIKSHIVICLLACLLIVFIFKNHFHN